MRKKWNLAATLFLCIALAMPLAGPALAAESDQEIQAAANRLVERGVFTGDENGNLNLDSGLTRAELAALLTRLDGEGKVNPELYTWACYFEDVPDWARPYVGYCVAGLLLNGYDSAHYGPYDPVTPAMACTVVLRCCGFASGEGSAWTYSTAGSYAAALGLIHESTTQASVITRGEIAVLVDRAIQRREGNLPSEGSVNAYYTSPDGSLTINADHWSREDFSQEANPAVFTGFYTRELYNTIRQTLVDYGNQDAPDYFYAYTMVAKGDAYSAAVNVLGRMDGAVRYEHYVPQNLSNYYEYLDYFAVSAAIPENFQDALQFIQPVIAEVNRLGTDHEKVEYLNDYLGTLLTYNRTATAGVTRTFAPHSEELEAACGSYAEAFQFLCTAANIPCIIITTDNHAWNLVYVDNEWLHVDTAANDLYRQHYLLLAETYPNHPDRAPEATAFLKELLVPGSTK